MAKASVAQQVQQVFANKNVPESVWEPIMLAESGGKANIAVADSGGASFGLFQLHIPSGQGDVWKQYANKGQNIFDTLENPVVNAEIASGPIAAAYQNAQLQGLSGQAALEYTAAYSGHPSSDGSAYGGSEWSNIQKFAAQGYGTTKQAKITSGKPTQTVSGMNLLQKIVVLRDLQTTTATQNGPNSPNNPYSGFANFILTLHKFENPQGNLFSKTLGINFANTTVHRSVITTLGILILLVAFLSFGLSKRGGIPLAAFI